MSPKPKQDALTEEMFEPITIASPRSYRIVYKSVLFFLYCHIAGLYGLYLAYTSASWITIVFNTLTFRLAATGIFAGAHRLWSHKSYKATGPLQCFLMICQSIANQHTVINWVRDHQIHHKYSDTDADPHNASRGFFFSHIGWLLVRKHPEVIRRGQLVDISDLLKNPYLNFQYRHKYWVLPLLSFAIPTLIPIYFWRETFSNAWNLNLLRYIINLNVTFMVNSIAHLWGYRPYDKGIRPVENSIVYYLTLGEGSHNYHHVFSWDYRSDEIGIFSLTTRFIDLCAYLGLVYDRRVVNVETVKTRAQRTGDGSFCGQRECELASK